MGIALQAANWILNHCSDLNITGRCLTLGKQDINFTPDQFFLLLAEKEKVLIKDGECFFDIWQQKKLQGLMAQDKYLSTQKHLRRLNYISDIAFFNLLGFDEVHSLDGNDYEGADYIYDLNRDDISTVIPTQYDLVLDSGTIEHVFHQPNVLKNIFDSLLVGGHVMHLAPSNNFVDHGFYQFSPTFFYDYYISNKFTDVQVQLVQITTDIDDHPWMFMNYKSGCLDKISTGGLDDKIYEVFVVARKTEETTYNVIPTQATYANKLWQNKI